MQGCHWYKHTKDTVDKTICSLELAMLGKNDVRISHPFDLLVTLDPWLKKIHSVYAIHAQLHINYQATYFSDYASAFL